MRRGRAWKRKLGGGARRAADGWSRAGRSGAARRCRRCWSGPSSPRPWRAPCTATSWWSASASGREEEVDKMMEQKMKEEQERRRKKEMEERMSLEETKEQITKLGERLQVLQEEKHQLFLQLKKVLHEEEKRRRKEQSDLTTLTAAAYQQGMAVHAGAHILNMQGSPGGHSRAGTLISADRAKQIFAPPVITQTRHFTSQPAFAPGTPEHSQYQSGQASHSPYAVGQGQHFPPGQAVPVSYTSSQPIRGPSAFPAMQYLSQQPPGYALHGHFPPAQPGFIPPSTTIPLQKQLEHANQQSGFTDSSGFPASSQPAARHPFIQHGQGQRFYHK
ncbi:G protein pathway suppressor 2 isoform X5 [Emydura macquarii macquarii]|uniref:G protein pathway suppressor 2 isoform X5 n=1 Tax=Emydura macquarii macquarii TaxID=1129001 RepID=UPI00352A114A